MTEVAQPFSLLAAVRAQLTLDSDSEDSSSPRHSHTDKAIHGKSLPDSSTNESQSLSENKPTRSITFDSTITSGNEPFPEYHEGHSLGYSEDEQAYKELFAAVMQEEIRTQNVDPYIDATPDQAEAKQRALDDMKDLLSHPHLRRETRQRFIALTNMVISLEAVLFRRGDDFLAPKEVADAQEIATVILTWIAWVDGLLQELVDTVGPVSHMLELLAREEVTEVVRYRRMACVVSAHLRKPRAPEQQLLSQYRDLYDAWVHNKFLCLRNRQIDLEEELDMDRLELTRYLHAIWDILSRCIDNYAEYRDALHVIKTRFFAPTLVQLPDVPEIEPCSTDIRDPCLGIRK